MKNWHAGQNKVKIVQNSTKSLIVLLVQFQWAHKHFRVEISMVWWSVECGFWQGNHIFESKIMKKKHSLPKTLHKDIINKVYLFVCKVCLSFIFYDEYRRAYNQTNGSNTHSYCYAKNTPSISIPWSPQNRYVINANDRWTLMISIKVVTAKCFIFCSV